MKTITRLLATAALLFGVVGGVSSKDVKTPVLLLKNGEINSTNFDISAISPSTLEATNLYAASFTSKEYYPSNLFQYQNLDVSQYDKIVIKFGENKPDGSSWNINLPDGNYTALPAGIDEYVISLANINTYSDFTIFNWFETGHTLTITECSLVKVENDLVHSKDYSEDGATDFS